MTTNDSNESTESQSHVNGDSGGHDITQSDELLAALSNVNAGPVRMYCHS